MTLAILLLFAMAGLALGIYAVLQPFIGSLISWVIATAASVGIYTWVLWKR